MVYLSHFFKGILIQTKEAQNATRKHIFIRSQRSLPSNTIPQLNIWMELFGLFEPRRYSFAKSLAAAQSEFPLGSGRFWFFDLQQTTSHNTLELGGYMDEVHFLGWKSSQQRVVSIVMHKSDSIFSQRIFVGRGFIEKN